MIRSAGIDEEDSVVESVGLAGVDEVEARLSP
jgi:hypothetical protein